MSKHIKKTDWLEAGMKALAEVGPPGLTVEAMCKRVGKTRGSYYHHFRSGDDFLEQLLGWWLKSYTHDLIEKAEKFSAHNDKLDHLNHLAAHLDPAIEHAFRRLAASNETAARTCKLVDDTRIAYLAGLYGQSSRLSTAQAHMLAKIEYAAWVGFQLIAPDAKPTEMLEMYDAFLEMTGRKD